MSTNDHDCYLVRFSPASRSDAAALTMIHPTSGSAAAFSPAAKALEGQVRAFGLQNLLRGHEPPASVEAQAADYVACLRMHGISGSVLGWSYGALIAFEMVRQGFEADPLILCDPPFIRDGMTPEQEEAVPLVRAFRAEVKARWPSSSPEPSPAELRGLVDRMGLPEDLWQVPFMYLDPYLALQEAHLGAQFRYRVQAARADVTLILVEEAVSSRGPEYLSSWLQVLGETTPVYYIPGDHSTMFTHERSLGALVAVIREQLGL